MKYEYAVITMINETGTDGKRIDENKKKRRGVVMFLELLKNSDQKERNFKFFWKNILFCFVLFHDFIRNSGIAESAIMEKILHRDHFR